MRVNRMTLVPWHNGTYIGNAFPSMEDLVFHFIILLWNAGTWNAVSLPVVKVQREAGTTFLYAPLFAEWHRKLRRRATDLWNAVERWNHQRLCWHVPRGQSDASGSICVSLRNSGLASRTRI